MKLAALCLVATLMLLSTVWAPTTAAPSGSLLAATTSSRLAQSPGTDAASFISQGSAGTIAPLGAGQLVILALNERAGGPRVVAYVGSLSARPLRLPPGDWWLYVLGDDGRVRQTQRALAVQGRSAIGSLDAGLIEVPGDPTLKRQAMAVLVHFALSSQLVTLVPLATPVDPGTVDQLAAAAASRREAVLAAADTLSEGALGSTADPVDGVVLRAASAGVWDGIKDSFWGFFGSDTMTGASARNDILAVIAGYSPAQRQELYNAASQRGDVDAGSAGEFFDRLGQGDYDHLARQLHQDFVASSEDYAIDAATAGRRPIDTAARDGAQLVKDGAQFYADVVKTVLGARFGPDFERGWDLAQTISDRLTEVDQALTDPAGYARDWIVGRIGDRIDDIEGDIKDRMRERILDRLREAGLSEEEAARLAGEIADRVAEGARDRIRDAASAIRDQVLAGSGPAGPAVPPAVPTTPADVAPSPVVPLPTATTAPSLPTATPEPSFRANAFVSPPQGPQGTGFLLNGTGFRPGEMVAVTISPSGSSMVLPASASGQVSGIIDVEPNAPTGSYTAALAGVDSGARTTAGFRVTGAATATPRVFAQVRVSPSSGLQGTTFQIDGSGFLPGESVRVVVSYPGGTVDGGLNATAAGSVAGTLETGAADATGSYLATLTGLSSGAQASDSFQVRPVASPTPTTPPVPTVVAATPTPAEPHGVFVAEDDVLVGQRTAIENRQSCSLRGWGLDCARLVKDVGPVNRVLGPYNSYTEARQAYCGAIVPDSVRIAPLTGGLRKAKFTFDGKEHWISNAPSC